MRRPTAVALAVLAAATLGACQTETRTTTVVAAAPKGVEGVWSSVGGPVAYTATFTGGRFVSMETATRAPLAEGTYVLNGPHQATINYRRPSTNEQIAVNCNQVQPDRLSCASSNGTRFDLARRA
ncbi:hypothetical protein [Mangrovibrevibacter kandeliae]|uniref:hypothetical protein n=1 Tax=Mangrovibrevibacter kandeliae TaxID=2968473 RepID=UPI0021182DDB|nr:hypothetical protein [Aurantimonas sp. CSK15Z-1]MCQ8783269.1 hypothetical protein [Aurantimonas sp. CSK15Z-1]